MFLKCFLLGAIFSSLLSVISCSNPIEEEIKVKTETEKNLYSLGAKFGTGLNALDLSPKEIMMVARGFTDAALNKKIEGIDDAGRAEKVQTFLSSRKKSNIKDIHKRGSEFLKDFIKSGGIKTSSGLVYQILSTGEGKKGPGPSDSVKVHYQFSLDDGVVVESTLGTLKPAQIKLDKIIKGWSEGIQLLKPGGQIKLVIPPELAYGDNGAPPKIPGGATLVVDVQLLAIDSTTDSKTAAQKE